MEKAIISERIKKYLKSRKIKIALCSQLRAGVYVKK